MSKFERKESGSDSIPIPFEVGFSREQISSDLFFYETVVRRVAVERANYVIPISPRMWKRWIAGKPIIAVDSPYRATSNQ